MSIDFNPFGPVCYNLLIPLGKSLVQPYVTLWDKSLRPLYQSITKPCKNYDQAVERFEGLIKTVELIAQFSVYFFLYQQGWHFGTQYLGLVGGAATFSLIYGAGCWVDKKLKTHMNTICTGTWLYYAGIRSFSTNREGLLAAVIVAGYLTQQHEKSSEARTSWDDQRKHAAGWLAKFFSEKQKPSLPIDKPTDGNTAKVVDSPQNLANRESK